MRIPPLLIGMMFLAGCHAIPEGATTSPSQLRGLVLGGSVVFENGRWVDKLYIENHGSTDVVAGDSFLGHWTFVGPDGVGRLMWFRQTPQCRFVVLRPVSGGPKGYVLREQLRVEVPLEADSLLKETSHAHIHFELSGVALIADGGKIVRRDFDLELEQDVPPEFGAGKVECVASPRGRK